MTNASPNAQLYVYYRVRPADAPTLIKAVRELQAGWQAALPGLVCTLSQRTDNDADLLTLMETYACVQGVAKQWRRKIEHGAAEKLAAWLVGERHVEVFVPCA